MQHGMHMRSSHRAGGSTSGISDFAVEVVARLVARETGGETALREELVLRLMAAAVDGDAASFEALKPELKRARISAPVLADLYIPEVARRLGCGWEDDSVSFAEVTIGSARLQAILREIGTTWTADGAGGGDGPLVLLVFPVGEQHTLGGMVLAGRLRRMGISVCVRMAPTHSELMTLVTARPFNAAFISVACKEKITACAKLVKTLKEASRGTLGVAVGGAILGLNADILSSVGADAVTNDVEVALGAMGVLTGRSPVLEVS
jgi:MerR family transcriptional regulator, light-induced transcriptional regulator